MPSRATKFTTMPNGNELTIPKIESLVLNQPDRNMGNLNNLIDPLPVDFINSTVMESII